MIAKCLLFASLKPAGIIDSAFDLFVGFCPTVPQGDASVDDQSVILRGIWINTEVADAFELKRNAFTKIGHA